MTFEGPPREGVIRLRCAYLELCTAISSRKRALPHGGHPLKYVASDSTMGQRRVGAVCAAIHAIKGHHPALHYGVKSRSHEQLLVVYDLGGGTFDVTILTMDSQEVRVLA